MAKITVAEPHGFCFGITRAIDLAKETAKKYPDKNIYFFGEISHNQHNNSQLELELKIKTIKDIKDIPENSVVIIKPHGTTPLVFQQAQFKNLIIIDATCPLVQKSHQTAINLINQNKKIIFVCSKINHDEAVGIVGENPYLITPITIDSVKDFKIDDPQNTIVMTQTTLSCLETKEVLDFIKNKYPEITILPHICQATSERQNAVIKLAKKYKFVVIIGSPTSANSNSLKSVAESVGAKSYIVDNASELNPKWFINQENIVISSGASTPEDILEKVVEKIKDITRR
jgi:4-hydroxy-3-methylbut-2-en-1-yl diphosphate reductase